MVDYFKSGDDVSRAEAYVQDVTDNVFGHAFENMKRGLEPLYLNDLGKVYAALCACDEIEPGSSKRLNSNNKIITDFKNKFDKIFPSAGQPFGSKEAGYSWYINRRGYRQEKFECPSGHGYDAKVLKALESRIPEDYALKNVDWKDMPNACVQSGKKWTMFDNNLFNARLKYVADLRQQSIEKVPDKEQELAEALYHDVLDLTYSTPVAVFGNGTLDGDTITRLANVQDNKYDRSWYEEYVDEHKAEYEQMYGPDEEDKAQIRERTLPVSLSDLTFGVSEDSEDLSMG